MVQNVVQLFCFFNYIDKCKIMATITYYLPTTKNEFASIYCRVRNGRKCDVRIVLKNLRIPIKYWDKAKEKVKKNEIVNYSHINSKLNGFKDYLEKLFNNDFEYKIRISQNWLRNEYEEFINIDLSKSETNPKFYLTDFFREFINNEIENYRTKRNKKFAKNTKDQYLTTLNKLLDFEIFIESKIKFSELNKKFCNSFVDFLENEQHLTNSTIQTYLTKLKSILDIAEKNDIFFKKVNDYLSVEINETNDVYLSSEELDSIEKLVIEKNYQENARNWFVLECNTGLRVSDLSGLKKSDIILKKIGSKEVRGVSVRQKKTGNLIFVPFNKSIEQILVKNNGDFPRKISDQKYNKYIKEVCQLANITQLVEGSKIVKLKDKNIYRKKEGKYPKYQLISSHTGRRTFATLNYLKGVKSYAIMEVTGHKSISTFENYLKMKNEELLEEFVNSQ